MLDHGFFDRSALEVAPLLLGARLTHETGSGRVVLRLTEVEAYLGPGVDPGSHAFRGPGVRNAQMFGPPGLLYVYRSYGVHACANIVCEESGQASAVLLRAAEVVEGAEIAMRRRSRQDRSGQTASDRGIFDQIASARTASSHRPDIRPRDLARGPGRLTVAAGIVLDDNGADTLVHPFGLELASQAPACAVGPRVGVSGEGGTEAFSWRFSILGDPTVSNYRPGVRRSR